LSAITQTEAAVDSASRHFQLHQDILGELGVRLQSGARVLDLGCGKGVMVSEYRRRGYRAFGAEINLATETPFLKRVSKEGYRLPFADDTFDFVYSDQVLEHVMELNPVITEIERVLTPGGTSLHIFPAKLKLVESHSFVPLAGVAQNYYWLLLWALLGVRNSFQLNQRAGEVAQLNYNYLKNNTRYRSRREIEEAIKERFDKVIFAESHFIKHTYGGARHLRQVVKLLPQVERLYSTFHAHVIFFEKSRAPDLSAHRY
jgi:ubiquinone/menaquinone biosynthesis C-methylase UbiE